jgi:hypothetical protein
MAASLFDLPQFKDANAARDHLESVRWPQRSVYLPALRRRGSHHDASGQEPSPGPVRVRALP